VRSSPAATLRHARDAHGARKASELSTSFQFDTLASHTKSTNLIYLQTMILMVLEADNHATQRGRSGPPRAVWLGAAVGLSYTLKLHINPSRTSFALNDLDADESLGRRNWWILVILDRWHAVSTSSPLLIPDSSVIIMPEDQSLLGDSVFHLLRKFQSLPIPSPTKLTFYSPGLSCIVGHLAELFVAPEDLMAPSSRSGPLISKLIAGEMERFRESVDAVLGSLHVVHLAYWHIRLLLKRHTPGAEPIDLLGPAEIIARILNSSNAPFTPLTHHFAALAALTLCEVADVPDVRDVARQGIKELQDALDQRRATRAEDGPTPAAATLPATGWVATIRDLLANKTPQPQQQPSSSSTTTGGNGTSSSVPNQGSLQHLADLAVGGLDSENAAPPASAQGVATGSGTVDNAPDAASPRLDFTALTRVGYLAALTGLGTGMENGR